MDEAYRLKRAKHLENCKSVNLLFEPIIFDVAGMCHPSSLAVLKDLSRRRAAREGSEDDFCVNRFLHRLSVAVQSGNGRAMLHHLDHLRLKSASVPESHSSSSSSRNQNFQEFPAPMSKGTTRHSDRKNILSTASKNSLSCYSKSSGSLTDVQMVSDSEIDISEEVQQANCPKLPRAPGISTTASSNNLSCYSPSIQSLTSDLHDGGSDSQVFVESDEAKLSKFSQPPATTGINSQATLSCYSSPINQVLHVHSVSQLNRPITRQFHQAKLLSHCQDSLVVSTSQNSKIPLAT